MRYCVADNDTEGNHAAERKSPLGNGDCNKARLAKAVFHGRLERVGTAEFGVCDDESDGPVDGDSESKEKQYAC